MIVADLIVTATKATVTKRAPITAGLLGAEIAIKAAADWDDLIINVTFQGAEEKTILNVKDKVFIPPEVVATPYLPLRVGIVGVSQDTSKEVVIPTLWADLGTIDPGATVNADEAVPNEPGTPSVWAQLQAMIGDLNNLTTEVKSSLVAAINWMVEKGIGTPEIGENGNWFIGGEDTGVSARGEQGPQGVSGVYVGSGEMPEGYNVQIDPEGEATPIVLTVNGKAPGENGNVDIEIPDAYSKLEIDAIMGAYINDIDTLLGGDA